MVYYFINASVLNCELIFYPFWKSRLKEVMIQRATILGEYSPLQETGRNIKLTSIRETVKFSFANDKVGRLPPIL